MLPIAHLGIGVSQLTLAVAYEVFGLDSTLGVSVSTFSQLGLLVSIVVGSTFFLLGRKERAWSRVTP